MVLFILSQIECNMLLEVVVRVKKKLFKKLKNAVLNR